MTGELLDLVKTRPIFNGKLRFFEKYFLLQLPMAVI
jgi:hypothetical protein